MDVAPIVIVAAVMRSAAGRVNCSYQKLQTPGEGSTLLVRDAMNPVTVTVGPAHTMREAARRMARGGVGAAVVFDPEMPAPGIITERDVLLVAGGDGDLDSECVADHLTARLVYAEPDWPLHRAAEAMTEGRFRHIVVVEHGEVVGIVSMRDIVRRWVQGGFDLAAASGESRD
jgi:signal-transduction protein with cAMP-binding, CBS, and nucleotidyltransferase domain